MEFWGAEIKAGKPLKVNQDGLFLLHISQASLGEAKKDRANESVVLYLNIDGKKLVIGTLSPDKLPQVSMDLVFERNFELSHNWNHGSVYFTGYRVPNDDTPSEDSGVSDSEDELVPATLNLGSSERKNVQVKPVSSEGKKVRIVEPEKKEEDDDSSEEASDDSSDDENKMNNGGGRNDDERDEDDEESDDEDDESDDKTKTMPEKKLDLKKKKKRVAESSVKTPVPNKKAKLVTPQTTEGKTSGGHIATPYPPKRPSKASASTSTDQKKEQTAKPFSCKPCNRTFGSDNALQSHNKAKHSS